MKVWTSRRGWILLFTTGLCVAGGCDDRSGARASPGSQAGRERSDSNAAPHRADSNPVAVSADGAGGEHRWQARPIAHIPVRFRPAAWVDTRTVVGLNASRIIRVHIDEALAEPGPPGTAWSVAAAPGLLSWTNEAGWWVQPEGGQPELRVPTAAAPPGTDGAPEALWSPDGSRAVLTWTGEGAAAYALAAAGGGALAAQPIHLSGYLPLRPLFWLDDDRILLSARALVRHDGTGGATEAGQRGDIAVYDVALRTARVVVRVTDDRFLIAVGMVATDSVLVVETDRQGAQIAAWAYHAQRWTRAQRALPAGRAFPHPSGRIAVITPDDGKGELVVMDGTRVHTVAGVRPAEAEPVVWSPDGRRLVLLDVAEEPARPVLVHASGN